MRLCYVDESFGSGYYCYAGLVVDGEAAIAIGRALDEVVSRAVTEWGVADDVEIHAYEIFHGKGAWNPVPPRARVAVFTAVVDALQGVQCSLLFRSVHLGRLGVRQTEKYYPQPHPPEQVCFTHLLQRVQRVAEREATHVLVVADHRDDIDRHRELFSSYRLLGTPGEYMTTALDRIVDTIHFAPSDKSRLLQAVDVLAFLYHRRISQTESDHRSRAAVERLWSGVRALDVVGMGTWP